MAEAFVYACQHGRIEVVRWFLDRGLNPDAAPFFGRTAPVVRSADGLRLLGPAAVTQRIEA